MEPVKFRVCEYVCVCVCVCRWSVERRVSGS